MTAWRQRLWIASLLALSACGHRRRPAPPAPAGTASAPLRFTATAYCTGRITAVGTRVVVGIAAADPRILPLGTMIRVSGVPPYDGSYRILDTGARVRSRHIDLYIPDCAAARRFGRRSVHVTILSDD